MTRRLILTFALLMVAACVFAQANAPNAAGHGAGKEVHQAAHGNEPHGESETPKTYLGIPGWLLKFANMLLFLGLLGWWIAKPIKSAFASRGDQIRREQEEAKQRRTKADQMASDIQARLTQIEQEVRALRERAEADGQKQRQELVAAAETEAAKILEAARNEVDNRLKSARQELTEYAGRLASERAESILREKITPDDQKKLFDDSLRDVSGVNG